MKADSGPLHVDPVLRERVRDAVRRLPEDLRIVVLMYDVEGYSHNDIAQILGISSGACRMRLSRAREQLRDLLSAEGAEWRE
jgi:RNA polymerase sigma-70 factor (ECF subfamily)